MELSGCHFEYAGVSSRKHNLIFANANTGRYTSLSGDITSNTIYNRGSNRSYLLRDDFTKSPISFDAEIISDTDRGIEMNERRMVEKWLFGKTDFCKLYVDMVDDVFGETYEFVNGVQKRLYLNCRFKNPEKMEYNGGIVGYKVTVECDSCMCWQDPVTIGFDIGNPSSNSASRIQLDVDSDLGDYIYPTITIDVGTFGGEITIVNESDSSSRKTKFVGITPSTSLIMKGEINYISDLNYDKFVGQNFVRLVEGKNNIIVSGNVDSITFEWQNRRYL